MSERQASVFISYSHKDEEWKERLVQHLRVLADEQGFDVWDDRRIEAGVKWKAAIEHAILSADVAVLLVSVDFLTSAFIKGKEIPPLLRLRDERRLDVVPIIVGDCAWRHVPWLVAMQARPKDGQALESMTKAASNTALARIAEEVGAKLARAAQARASVSSAAASQSQPSAESSDAPTARPAIPAPDHAVVLPRVEPAATPGPLPAPPPVPDDPPRKPAAEGSPAVAPASSASEVARGLAEPASLTTERATSAPRVESEAARGPQQQTRSAAGPTTSIAGAPRGESPLPAPVDQPQALSSAAAPTPEQRKGGTAWDVVRSAVLRQPLWLLLLLLLPAAVVGGVYLVPRLLGKARPAASILDLPLAMPSPTAAWPAWPTGVKPSSLAFTTMTVDERGAVVSQRGGTAPSFTENLDGVALEMVAIPGGTFMMGSPDDEAERSAAEGPARRVTIAPFFMGRFEVTQAQWRAVATWPQLSRALTPRPAFFKGDGRPVENVSWHDAIEFCARLSRQTGRAYRLPSEAEWEYAARAGTTSPFAFGPTVTPELVNYDGNYPYGHAPKGQFRGQTAPVDALGKANPFGLFDMHGNVWEWVQDTWHANSTGAPSDGTAWEAGGASAARVVRGGSWYLNARYCRSAYRTHFDAVSKYNRVGFRVLCSVAEVGGTTLPTR